MDYHIQHFHQVTHIAIILAKAEKASVMNRITLVMTFNY